MAAKQVKSKGTGSHVPKKIEAPRIVHQSGGDMKVVQTEWMIMTETD